MSKYLKTLLIVISVVAIALAGCNLSHDLPDPMRIEPTELTKAYAENEVAADSRYKGRTLILPGKVQSVYRDGDWIVVRVSGVSCLFTAKQSATVAGLGVGDSVTVRGICSGDDSWGVTLRDCQLA